MLYGSCLVSPYEINPLWQSLLTTNDCNWRTLALTLLLLLYTVTSQIRRTRRYKFLRFVGKAPLLKSDTNQEIVLKQYPRYEIVGMSVAARLNGDMVEQDEWYGRVLGGYDASFFIDLFWATRANECL